jgi:hypothetical protein
MDLFQSPPQPDDELFARHAAERKAMHESQKRAVMIGDALNSMEGVTCKERCTYFRGFDWLPGSWRG